MKNLNNDTSHTNSIDQNNKGAPQHKDTQTQGSPIKAQSNFKKAPQATLYRGIRGEKEFGDDKKSLSNDWDSGSRGSSMI